MGFPKLGEAFSAITIAIATVWGTITGTLSDQVDLNAALNNRVLKAGDTMNGTLQIDVPTTTDEGLVVTTTDGNATNNLLEVKDSGGTVKTAVSPLATNGAIANPDLEVGGSVYGMIQIGDALIGRTSFNSGSMDLDGAILYRNMGGPITGEIEHVFTESAGASTRFALPKSAIGNATYNSRSMLLVGPAPADTDYVKVGYWQTNENIFDNLACDVSADGADLGVQNDLEVEGDVFTDSLKESTVGSGVSVNIGNLKLINFAELRFHDDGDNHVGFEAPALSANQIWILPNADGVEGSVLQTDGAGALTWGANDSEKSWAFKSRDASTGINYIGGFYRFGATDNDFNPSITFGTANLSYAAHFFLVQAAGGAGGTDTVIRITGTTIDDTGTRTAGVNVDVTVDDAGVAGTYYETSEKWLGQITIVKLSGPDLLMNYGFAKYWDNNNNDFKVVGFEATWLGAQNDANPDIKLRHHKTTGWTYNNAAAPTPPAELASMATDHGAEKQIATDQEGAWKRDDLSTAVVGSGSEGTIIELTTTANRAYAIGNFILRIVPQ